MARRGSCAGACVYSAQRIQYTTIPCIRALVVGARRTTVPLPAARPDGMHNPSAQHQQGLAREVVHICTHCGVEHLAGFVGHGRGKEYPDSGRVDEDG